MLKTNLTISNFCNKPIRFIENYETAVNDLNNIYVIHHKKECENGYYTPKKIKEMGLYYERPPEELIFMTISEHIKLHNECRKLWKENML